MRVRLLRDSRIRHKAGETVEVSPAEAQFLLSIQSAELVREDPPEETVTEEKPKRRTAKK